MKNIFFIFLFLLICTLSNADEIQIPFSCWPFELQKEFSVEGIKLDLDPNKRTDDSWGYVMNKGSHFSLFTYKSATPKDFEIIKQIVTKIEMTKNE